MKKIRGKIFAATNSERLDTKGPLLKAPASSRRGKTVARHRVQPMVTPTPLHFPHTCHWNPLEREVIIQTNNLAIALDQSLDASFLPHRVHETGLTPPSSIRRPRNLRRPCGRQQLLPQPGPRNQWSPIGDEKLLGSGKRERVSWTAMPHLETCLMRRTRLLPFHMDQVGRPTRK